MNEPKYVKDLFEENFIDEWIDFTFNYSINDYSIRIVEAVKTAMSFAEQAQKYNDDELYNQIHCIDALTGTNKLSFSKYKAFITNFPIMMPLAIEQFYLQGLIQDEFDCMWTSDYINCEIDIKKMISDSIKGSFNAMLESEISLYENLAENIPSIYDAVENCGVPPFIQLGILYDFLKTAINTINQTILNFLHNAETLLHFYFDFDSYYFENKDVEDLKKFILHERTDFINKNIILRNIDLMHGGREKLSNKEKALIWTLKNDYDRTIITLRKVRFLSQNIQQANICKIQVIYNLGNLSFQDVTHQKALTEDVDIIFNCPKDLIDKGCKYKKGQKCTISQNQTSWNVLKYIQNENSALKLYLSNHLNIKTEKMFKELLNKYTNSSIALMFVKFKLASNETAESQNIQKKTDSTLIKDFSNIKNVKIENERMYPPKLLIIKNIFDKLYSDYLFTPQKEVKKEIKLLIKILKELN